MRRITKEIRKAANQVCELQSARVGKMPTRQLEVKDKILLLTAFIKRLQDLDIRGEK